MPPKPTTNTRRLDVRISPTTYDTLSRFAEHHERGEWGTGVGPLVRRILERCLPELEQDPGKFTR